MRQVTNTLSINNCNVLKSFCGILQRPFKRVIGGHSGSVVRMLSLRLLKIYSLAVRDPNAARRSEHPSLVPAPDNLAV